MKTKVRSAHLTACAGAVAMYALTTMAANASVGVTVNGSAVDLDPAPIVQAGRVFVPLRGVFEELGASVVYSNGTINATGNGRDISLQIGSTQATVNGQSQTIDVAPFIVGASTYVPLRFISESLGDSVSWDDAGSVAEINTGGGAADYYSPGTASYVDTAPPPIPVYDQPAVTNPNYIWQPGYWGWGPNGYYWIPGTWVAAPQPGYLWTPGYWQGNGGGFNWNPGYWATLVGFYGGVNYGSGYYGNGYTGGQWQNNTFRYNTYVTRVNTTIIRNVYVNRSVNINNSTHVSYNGGQYGLRTRPTAQQLSVARQRHIGMTESQRQHVKTAETDRRLLATVNQNKPPVLAVARPLNPTNRPAGFAPVKKTDRVNPLANVAPVRVAPVAAAGSPNHTARVRTAGPVPQAPAVRPATVVQHAPAVHAPAPVAPPVRIAAPAVRAPAPVPPVRVAAPVYRAPVIHEAAPVERAPVVHEAAPVHEPAVYAAPPHLPAPARIAAPPHLPAPARVAAPHVAGPPHVATPHVAAPPRAVVQPHGVDPHAATQPDSKPKP